MIGVIALSLALLAQPDQAPTLEVNPPDTARAVALSRVFPFWDDYQAMPEDERDAFVLAYRFSTVTEPENGGQWRFWTDTGNGPEPLPLGPTGVVTPPEGLNLESGGVLITDAPEGGVAVAMSLSPNGPLRENYDVEELRRATAQAHNAVRSLMGLRALVMPRLDTVQFVFEGSAPTAVLITEDGEEEDIMTVYENVITFRPRARSNRNGVEIRFGAKPISVTLEAGR